MTAELPMSVAEERQEMHLIAAILAGERERFHELIRPYERQLYLTAFALVKNETEAEDVVQEAVIKAYRKLASFRGEAKFSTWLTAITLNEARFRLRSEKRAAVDSLDDQTAENGDFTPAALTDWREVPSESLERMELRCLLQESIAELPDAYRQIVILRDLEEISIQETSELLGISVSLVKVRLHRAHMMLQKKLAPQLQSMLKPERRKGIFGRFPWF
jgi:RNA polymerase sigma-70 factor, ECF subfamily